MSNPYTVCRGGAGTENVLIMQQTEGRLDWLWKNKASPARPADAAHVWAASPDLQKEYYDKVVEMHGLENRYTAQVFDLNAEIVALKETLKEKNERLKVERATIAALNKENRDLNHLKQISFDQQAEIQSLKRQLPHKVARDVDIGTALQILAPASQPK